MTELKPFAFVLMPFSKEFDDIYKLGIQATANECGIVAERVDEQIYSETMLERIYRQIDAADFIIADMTGRNPNVFHEVGYAHAKDKLCTLLTRNAADIPFDLKHHRHLVYEGSIQRLRECLAPELKYLKEETQKRKSSSFAAEVKTSLGTLIRDDEWRDRGSLELVIEIHNPTQRRSAEIEAVYLYTTNHWVFSQGGQECGFRDVVIDGKRRQHLLSPPVTRLSPNAWAQIRTVGERTLWLKWDSGEGERKEEYRIVGHILLEIITSEGNFREKLNLDVTFDEIPF